MKKIALILAISLGAGLTSSRAQNTWTQKADFGGNARYGAVGFSIGSKGYLGTGSSSGYKKDFREYDPALNIWTKERISGELPVAALSLSASEVKGI